MGAAEAAGLRAQMETFSDQHVRDVLLALQPSGGRPHASVPSSLPYRRRIPNQIASFRPFNRATTHGEECVL